MANKLKMRTVYNRNGKKVVLLNPNGKGKKYAFDLRTGKKHTNTGKVKKNWLSKSEKAYRSGYLKAREDIGKASASARKYKKGKKFYPVVYR